MFEKVGGMNHNRFSGRARVLESLYVGDGPPILEASQTGAHLPLPKDCSPFTHCQVTQDVTRFSHLLDGFLEKAESPLGTDGAQMTGDNIHLSHFYIQAEEEEEEEEEEDEEEEKDLNKEERNHSAGSAHTEIPRPIGNAPGDPSEGNQGRLGPGEELDRGPGVQPVGGLQANSNRNHRARKVWDSNPCSQHNSWAMRKKCRKDLMINSHSLDGLSGMWNAYGARTCQPIPAPEGSPQRGSESLSSSSHDGLSNSGMTLDPSEHEWMLAAAEGNWAKMARLLETDLNLLDKKDFITGLTAVHWLAKRGQAETLIELVRFAESRAIPLDVNTKASGGYTALHLAAMQGHPMVIKLLVGAYNASVDIRDYRGKKAWQYLSDNVPSELKLLTGAQEEEIRLDEVSKAAKPGCNGHGQLQGNASLDQLDSSTRKEPALTKIVSLRKLFKPSLWRRKRTEQVDAPKVLLM